MYRVVQNPNNSGFSVETKIPTLFSLLVNSLWARYSLKYEWIPTANRFDNEDAALRYIECLKIKQQCKCPILYEYLK